MAWIWTKWPNVFGHDKPMYQRLSHSAPSTTGKVDSISTETEMTENTPLSKRETRFSRFAHTSPWILCLFLMIALGVSVTKDQSVRSDLAHEQLRPTDFKPSAAHIEQEIVTFTGSPVFDENGTFWVPHPSKQKYTGEPSPEIDENWETLTAGRYFLITAEEAVDAFGAAPDSYWNDKVGGYTAGIDMFHALHCLNRLRQALWPEYYPREKQMGNTRIHRDHCIDHIRQMLMCAGDMTLIPTEWTEQLGHNYVQADVPHTCRNFEKLHSFVQSRRYGPGAVAESSEKKHNGSGIKDGHH